MPLRPFGQTPPPSAANWTPPPHPPPGSSVDPGSPTDNPLSVPSTPVTQDLVAARGTQVVMLDCPDMAESKHVRADKQQYMTRAAVKEYVRVLRELRDGPWHWLPIHDITIACNDACSFDGVHSDAVVYDAVVQWLANQLHLGV